MTVTSNLQEKANTFTTPIALSLDLNSENRLGYNPYFTGWKEIPTNPNCYVDGSEPIGTGKAVGQIVCWIRGSEGKQPRAAFVNLPGYQHGIIVAGASFDIGDQRLDLLTLPSSDEMEAMLVKGLEILKETMETA